MLNRRQNGPPARGSAATGSRQSLANLTAPQSETVIPESRYQLGVRVRAECDKRRLVLGPEGHMSEPRTGVDSRMRTSDMPSTAAFARQMAGWLEIRRVTASVAPKNIYYKPPNGYSGPMRRASLTYPRSVLIIKRYSVVLKPWNPRYPPRPAEAAIAA